MGIVVTIAMLLALLLLLPSNWMFSLQARASTLMVAFVGACGLWNFAWYGLQHLNEFWGNAALFSGLALVLAAVLVLANSGNTAWLPSSMVKGLRSCKNAIIVALLGSFLLYSITLIQLNLGLPILR